MVEEERRCHIRIRTKNPGDSKSLAILVTVSTHDTLDIDSRLWQANGAIRRLKEERGELVLATSEKAHLKSLIESWVEEPVPEVRSPQLQSLAAGATKRSVQTVAASLPAILGAIEASASLIEGIYQKLQSLTKNQIPVFEVTTALVGYMPERSEEIATEIRVGITSESEDVAGNAMSGLYTWLTSSSDDESQNLNPPDDLIRGSWHSNRFKTECSNCSSTASSQVDI